MSFGLFTASSLTFILTFVTVFLFNLLFLIKLDGISFLIFFNVVLIGVVESQLLYDFLLFLFDIALVNVVHDGLS